MKIKIKGWVVVVWPQYYFFSIFIKSSMYAIAFVKIKFNDLKIY